MPAESAPLWSRLLPLLAVAPCLAWAGGAIIQHDIWISDLLHSQLPYRAFLGESLRAGHFPLWMPDIFSGVPFLAQIEAGGLYPPHLLIFALLPPFSALNVALGLDMLLMALGAAALARRLGASHTASALAAVVYAWCGFSISHFRHINMHAAAALLPWMVLALEGVIAGQRRAGIALAGLIGLQLLAGHPQITWISLLLLGARTAISLPGAPDRLRIAASALAAVVLGAGLSAVQLLPVARFTSQSLATVDPTWEYAAAYPYRWQDLLTWVYPPAVGAMETFDYIGGNTIPWGNYGYCGLAVLLLAPLALRERGMRFWAVTALLSAVLVMGPLTPLYRLLWEVVPGMKLFRFPTRFLMTASLALCVLGAVGLTRLTVRRRRLAVVVVALSLVDLTWHQSPRIPIDDVAPWAASSPIARLQPGTQRVYTMGEFELWEDAFFASEGFNKGFSTYRGFWQIPMGSSGVLSGIRSPSGYARMVHYRCAAFWQGYNWSILPEQYATTRPTPESPEVPAAFHAQLSRAGVRYLLIRFPVTGAGLLLRGDAPLYQYENTAALPRAYVAGRWHVVEDMGAAAEWMYREGLDHPAIPAIEGLEAAPAEAAESLTPVTVTEHSTDHLSLDVSGAPAGLLVLTDTWDPGWSVTIDGAPATLLIANGYQRAVRLPPGARRVTMTYWPDGLSAGLAISLGCGLLLLVWGLRTTKTGRRFSSS